MFTPCGGVCGALRESGGGPRGRRAGAGWPTGAGTRGGTRGGPGGAAGGPGAARLGVPGELRPYLALSATPKGRGGAGRST